MTYRLPASRQNHVRILLVDDDPVWRKLLRSILRRHLGKVVQIAVAANYDQARTAIFKRSYDLISLDLQLAKSEALGAYSGQSLLEIIRRESKEPDCGLIVLSGYGTEDIAVESLRDYRVDDFIKKSRVDINKPDAYVEAVKKALRRSLLQRAAADVNNRILLTLGFSKLGLNDGELRMPGRITKSTKPSPHRLDVAHLFQVGEEIEQQILYGRKGAWRSTARKVGRELYQNLKKASPIHDLFLIGRELAGSTNTFHLQFSGPSENVGLPFELMYDEDYLVFNHIITRGLSEGTRSSERFHEFVDRLCRNEKPQKNTRHLEVVVVGANMIETTPRCEDEAQAVATSIEKSLDLLNIPHNIKLLVGRKNALYQKLETSLRDGCHIFHFSGHANYVRSNPEKSVIYLYDRAVSAASMKSIFRNKDVRLAFLSCCLGAYLENKKGRGEFYGFFDALSKSGIPAILGYRWPVSDESAKLLAEHFYENLFRHFCPARSLYLARDRAASEIGRDEDIWASPVLLMQNY